MRRITTTALAAIGVHTHLSAEQKQDLATAAYQSAPGTAAAGTAGVFGLPLSDVLILTSIAFVALQAAHLVWKWRRDSRRDQERQDDRRRGHDRRRGLPVETDLGALGADE